jgi:hypothetical protein
MSDFLLNLQADLEGLLLSDPSLAEVPVLVERKGLTEEDVAQSIGVMNSRGSSQKVGICIVVLMPSVRKPQNNATLQLSTTATLRVIELPVVNQSDGGIGLAAESACTRILQILHNWSPDYGRTFSAGADTIEPADAPDAHIAYDLNIAWTDGIEKPLKTPKPSITYDAESGQVSISCSDDQAIIYYTEDGSFPYPENPTVEIYNEPVTHEGVVVTHRDGIVTYEETFTAASSTWIRAIAIRTGYAPSNLKSITLSEIE